MIDLDASAFDPTTILKRTVQAPLKKPRVDDVLAELARRKVGDESADDYLFYMLGGHDGVAEWTLEKAASWARGRLKKPVRVQQVSRWFRKKAQANRAYEAFEAIEEARVAILKQNPDVDESALAQYVTAVALADIISGNDPDQATDILDSITRFRKSLTEEGKLKQRVKEFEEGTKALRAQLEALKTRIKEGGENPEAHIDKVIQLVDRTMGIPDKPTSKRNSKKKAARKKAAAKQ